MGGFRRTIQKAIGMEEPVIQQVQQEAVKREPKGPVSAEVDQYTARKLASNRRGRNALILKSTTGSSEDVTLGKKALLS